MKGDVFDIAVLFARKDSIYKQLHGLDVYDIDRNALTFPGGKPVIAHPPCRAWGKLRAFAKPRPGEKELAIWTVDQVRKWGGVLEHPQGSKLWAACDLPLGKRRDNWGGWTLVIDQFWFGHLAKKTTYLYIVGIEPCEIPPYPIRLGRATHTISSVFKKNHPQYRPETSKSDREHTPAQLATWLVSLVIKINTNPIKYGALSAKGGENNKNGVV